MDELIKMVAEKTGVSEEIAGKVIGVVVDILKDKLPAPFDSQIEGILSGDVDAESLLGGSGGFGGLLKSLMGGGKR